MTEEKGGAEKLGTLEVDVQGNLQPLEQAIARGEAMLKDFLQRSGEMAANATSFAAPKGGRSRRAPTAATADTSPAAAGKVSASGTVSFKGARKAIQADLNEPFDIKINVPDDLKIKIDTAYLTEQIKQALGGNFPLMVNADISPGAAHAGGGPMARPAYGTDVTKALKQVGGLEDSIHALYRVLDTSLKNAGKAGVGGLDEDAPALDKLDRIADRFGITTSKIVEMVKEPGKPEKVVGGVFGPKSAALEGLDPQDAKVITQGAKTLAKLSAGSAFLTTFFDDRAKRPAQPQAAPAMTPAAFATAIREALPAAQPQHQPSPARDTALREQLEQATADAKVQLASFQVTRLGQTGKLTPAKLLERYVNADNAPGEVNDAATARRRARSRGGAERRVSALEAAQGGGFTSTPIVRDKDGNVISNGQVRRTASDPAADIQALEQLGGINVGNVRRRINLGALQGSANGVPIDLRGLAVAAARGELSNFLRHPKTGEFFQLRPEGDPGTSARADSEARIRSLMTGAGRRTIPGIEGQVVPMKPGQLIEQIVHELFGESGTNWLAQPAVQAELKKAVALGPRLAPRAVPTGGFEHVATGGSASILGGLRDAEEARKRGFGLDPATAAAMARQHGEESRGRVAGGFGLSTAELADRRLQDMIPAIVRERINVGGLPDFPKALTGVLNEVSEGKFSGSARGFAKNRTREIRDELLGQLEKPDKKLLEPLMKAISQDVVDSLAPGPGRKALMGGRFERGKSFAEIDVRAANAGSGGFTGFRTSGKGPAEVRRDALIAEHIANIGFEPSFLRAGDTRRLGRNKSTTANNRMDIGQSEFADTRRPAVPEELYVQRNRVSGSAKAAITRQINKTLAEQAEFDARREASRSQIERQERITKLGPRLLEHLGRQAGYDPSSTEDQTPIINKIRETLGRRKVFGTVGEEALSRVQFRAPGAGDRVLTGKGRTPASGDESRAIADRSSIVAGGLEGTRKMFSDYNYALGGGGKGGGGRGVGVDDGGRFSAGGVPIEVIVVGNFPLPVTIEGGSAAGSGGVPRKGRGKRGRVDEDETPKAAATPSTTIRKLPNARVSAEQREAERAAAELTTIRKLPTARVSAEQRAAEKAAADATQIQYIDKAERAREKQREREAKQAAAAAARAARAARPAGGTGRGLVVDENYDIRASYRDLAEDELGGPRAKLRRAERRVPKRGFTASVTDLVTATLGGGGFEKQLEELGRAGNELQELRSLKYKRADLLGRRDVLSTAAAAPGLTPDRVSHLNGLISKVNTQLGHLEPAIARSTAKFEENVKSASSFSRTARSFGAAAVGAGVSAAAGSVSFGLGMALTAPLIQGIATGVAEGIGPIIERLSGYAGTTGRVTGEVGQGIIAAGGLTELAYAQHAVSIGLASSTAGRFGPVVSGRAETEAGNKQLQAQIDEMHAYENISRSNAGRFGDRNLTETTGGVFGTELFGQASTAQLIYDQLKDVLPTPEQREARSAAQARNAQRVSLSGKPIPQPLGDAIDGAVDAFDDATARLGFFNEALKKGGDVTAKFTDQVKLDDTTRSDQVRALMQNRAPGLAELVLKGQLAITDKGKGVTDPNRIAEILKSVISPKPDLGELVKLSIPQIQAQEGLRLQRIALTKDTLIPAQLGLADAVSPLAPAKAGINTTGLSKAQAAGVNRELAQTQKLYNGINAEAEAGRKIAVDFVRGQLGDEMGGEFEKSLSNVVTYGKQIAGIQIDLITKNAAYQAAQFSYQIGIAKRNLMDAKGLVSGVGSSLGAVERQQYNLNRESQKLGLEQSQRSINFQVAVAGFTAPGLTSEERQARIDAAKQEAAYAQKQLDIQKQLYALAGKAFGIQAGRAVHDLEGQLALLEQGRVLTIDTAVAEKRIIALTKLQEKENKKVELFYQEAVSKAGDIMTLEAQLVAQTGKDLSIVAQYVLDTYATVYNGLINQIKSGKSGSGSGVDGGLNGGGTTTRTSSYVPASTKTDATIIFQGAVVREDADINKIATAVERKINERGQLLGIRPFGG